MGRRPKGPTPEQILAMDALSQGKPYDEVVEVAGVDVNTLRDWLTTDADFLAERNRRRGEIHDEADGRLVALLPKAVDALQALLEGEDAGARLRAAQVILRSVALEKRRNDYYNPGDTDADAVRKTWERALIFGRM